MEERDQLVDEVEAVLDAARERMTTVEPQLRRFAQAMADLGAAVPPDWATHPTGDTVEFGALTARQFDRLVCLVEDLAANRPVHVTVMRSGPTLFDPGAPRGPAPTPATSTVHLVVPR